VESSCKIGNKPSGSIKCWELPSGCTTCGLSSGTQLHRVSKLVSPMGIGPKNDCAGEGQQQLQFIDPSPHPRGHSTSVNPNLSHSRKCRLGPQMGA
jgi:hypothetical protein